MAVSQLIDILRKESSCLEHRVSALEDLLMMASYQDDAREQMLRLVTNINDELFTTILLPLFQWTTNVLGEDEFACKEAREFAQLLFLEHAGSCRTFWTKLFALRTPNLVCMGLTATVFLFTNLFDTAETSVKKLSPVVTKYSSLETIVNNWLKPILVEELERPFVMHTSSPVDRVRASRNSEALIMLGAICTMGDQGLYSEVFELAAQVLKRVNLAVQEDRFVAVNTIYAVHNWMNRMRSRSSFEAYMKPLWGQFVSSFTTIFLRALQDPENLTRHAECILRIMMTANENWGTLVVDDCAKIMSMAHPWVFREHMPMSTGLKAELLGSLFDSVGKQAASKTFVRHWVRSMNEFMNRCFSVYRPVPSWCYRVLAQCHEISRDHVAAALDHDTVMKMIDGITEDIRELVTLATSEDQMDELAARVPTLTMLANCDHDGSWCRYLVESVHVVKLLDDIKGLDATKWPKHAGLLRQYSAALRFFLIVRMENQDLWRSMISAWSDVPFEGPSTLIRVLSERHRAVPASSWDNTEDLSILGSCLTLLGAAMDNGAELDFRPLHELEVAALFDSPYDIAKVYLVWLCTYVSKRPDAHEHPLMKLAFWDLPHPKLRCLLAQWQSVSALHMLANKKDMTEDGAIADWILDLKVDFDQILGVFHAIESTNFEARVYIVQFVAVAYHLNLYEAPVDAEVSTWITRTLLVQLDCGSWETVCLLKCLVQWGQKFSAQSDLMDVIQRRFVDSPETSLTNMKVIEDLFESFVRST